ETRGLRALSGSVVAHAELHPDNLGALSDGFVGDLPGEFRAAENLHEVDRIGNGFQIGINALAQNLLSGEGRIDRDDAVALPLQIFHYEEGRAVPFLRRADLRDR